MLLRDVFILLRPQQWMKNLFIFPALIFSRHLFNPAYFLKSLAAFFLFCLLSGSAYIINDIMDVDEDRHHPRKKTRPLASGRVPISLAWVLFLGLSLFSLSASFALEYGFGIIALVYFALNVSYSLYLKRVVILDVLIVSSGFVIRAAAGGIVLDVEVSHWLLVCTALLALFLVLAKRRHERAMLEEMYGISEGATIFVGSDKGAIKYRRSLDEYSTYFLDQMIAVTTASTLMGYILYTVSEETIKRFGGARLLYTVPFVIYGIFRYLYLIHQKKGGGSPTRSLLGDWPLMAGIALWGICVVVILYI
jgi:4-hydroxybenzoate polyprenyltransferase